MFTAYPDKGPEISGTQAHYLPGDYITANCTSGKSNPPAELEWLINGAKVPTTSFSVCLSATGDESEVSRSDIGLKIHQPSRRGYMHIVEMKSKKLSRLVGSTVLMGKQICRA